LRIVGKKLCSDAAFSRDAKESRAEPLDILRTRANVLGDDFGAARGANPRNNRAKRGYQNVWKK